MTIPANQLVNIVPSVLSAGGSALVMNGLVLTVNTRVPYNQVLSFSSLAAVQAYFGATSQEATVAAIYFLGFLGCSQYPAAIFFAQYPQNAIYPYLRGGPASGLSLAQLQAIAAGTMTVTVNGVIRTSASISLASAVSFSNAASLIQTAFNSFDAVTGSGATIAAGVPTSVVGAIVGNVLTVVTVNSGALVVGGVLSGTGGGGVPAGCTILNQISGTTGGVGVYTVSTTQNVSTATLTQSYGLLTAGTITSGTIAVGQVLSGSGTLAAGTYSVTALASGTGGSGTYVISGGTGTYNFGPGIVSLGQLLVTYDSVSGAFVLTGGTPGPTGTMTQASGAIATSLFLTTVTGAVLSQGAAAATPSAFMTNLVQTLTTNWAAFMTIFNPDAFGNAVKLLFAQWNNTQNNRFLYSCWDTDVTPTLSAPAASSLGQLLAAQTISGTELTYDPLQTFLAAFPLAMVASTNFSALNGRITQAYKAQSGLTLTVTGQTVASNLILNGYNFYGQYATANQLFNFFQNGSISGPYLWADSYTNQIWLNAALQLALLNLEANSNSIPYTPDGYAAIEASIAGVAAQGLFNGVISAGVTLSANQIVEINTAAGTNAAGIVSSRGWYAQVIPATAQVRAARTTPPINFWYADGGSVQQITLASIEVQ